MVKKIQSNSFPNHCIYSDYERNHREVKYATVSNYYPTLGVHPVIIPNMKILSFSKAVDKVSSDDQQLCNNYASIPNKKD